MRPLKKGPGRPRKTTVKAVAESLQKHNGFLSLVAQDLNCSRDTVERAIQREPSLQAAYREVKEARLDFTESVLLAEIRARNLTAVIFFLKTQGKARGYSERVELHDQNALAAAQMLADAIAKAAKETPHREYGEE